MSAHDNWEPVDVYRVLSVVRGGHVDLRAAIALHSDAITENCSVQFIATDICGSVEPSRFSCSGYIGPILFQHRGCLAEREFATFLVSSPTETSANVSIFSVEIVIEPARDHTSEITLQFLQSNLSDGAQEHPAGVYNNYKIIFPEELIGRCHYEIVTDWPYLFLPSAGTLTGATNQPLPCGFMDADGLMYFPKNISSPLVYEDHMLIKVHSHGQHKQNQFVVVPIELEPQESANSSSTFEELPPQEVVIHQGANTPIQSSLFMFANSSISLHLSDSRSLYRFTFPVLNAGSFQPILSSLVNITHTTFTNRDLLKGTVAFYPNFTAPERTDFHYTITNVAGEMAAMGYITVVVKRRKWEWPVQRTNRPLRVVEGGSSIFDQRTLDFYLQTDLCSQLATIKVGILPEHGRLTFTNGSDFGRTSLLIGAIKNGSVLEYHHSNSSEELTDSIIWEVSCPGSPALQVFTSVLVATSEKSPTRLLRGWDIKVHRGFTTPISPSAVVTSDLDSQVNEISVALGQDARGKVVKFDWKRLNKQHVSSLFPYIDSERLRAQRITQEVLTLSLSELDSYSICYIPPANSTVTNESLTFSIGDSSATVGVDIIDRDLNQTLYLSTLGEYPSVLLNVPLPLYTSAGTYITSAYLYSRAQPNPPDEVVYLVHSPPTKGRLCLLSGGKCLSSISMFSQRDINTENVYYKPMDGEGSFEEDSFEFELTLNEFRQHTASHHKFYFKPVKSEVEVVTDSIIYVRANGNKSIAPRHFKAYKQYFNTRDLVFQITRRPHHGRLELRGQPNPTNFSFEDLLGMRDLVYKHYSIPSAKKVCSDKFSFTVGNSTHSLDGSMTIAIRYEREDVQVHVDVGRHTLFLERRKFVFGSDDINVSSSFCLDFVTFTLKSQPSLGMLSLIDNKHNTVIQLQENSTFSASDIYSGFLHYTFTNLVPVTNQMSDLFTLAAEDPASSWPSDIEDRIGGTRTTGHFHVIIIPSPDVTHELAIDITSPGYLTWLPQYDSYGYVFSENDIEIFNSTIEPDQVTIQLSEEPEFGSIWRNTSMDNIFTVEDVNNGLVWYRSDLRLADVSRDSFMMSIVITLMGFSELVKEDMFVLNWATVQLLENNMTVRESDGQVEIVVR